MRIVGHGIDIIEVERIAHSIRDHGDRFLERVFTANELLYAGKAKRRDEHLAARFAAKEAVMKALGTGWGNGVAWTQVEVVLLPSGQPTLALSGRAAQIARDLGITDWSLSLTHTKTTAAASAIATGA
jgi:holo-[acyl-carrier protein] synthase